MNALNDGVMCAAGVRGQAENFKDFLLMRFWPGRLPDMHSTAVAALQRGRDALLAGQRFA